MRNKNLFSYFIVALVSGLVGYFSTQFPFFEIDYKINLVAVVSILITASIGLYIANTIQHRQRYSRIEKDMLIDELKKIKGEVEEIHGFVVQQRIPFDKAVFLFKIISGNISALGDLLEICNCHPAIDLTKLHSKHNNLKRIVTSAPIQLKSLVLGPKEVGDFINEYRNLLKEIFITEITINRLK